jgi:LPS-assembly protein
MIFRADPLGRTRLWASVSMVLLCAAAQVEAQVPPPDRRTTFQSDTDAEKARRETEVDKAIKPDKELSEDLDVKAPQLEFLKESNEIEGKGGVLISRGGVQIQADQARVNMESKQGKVSGNVILTGPDGTISADSADLNVESETGDFYDADFTIEQGGYRIAADKASKLSEFEFRLEESKISTCHCADDSKPWYIGSSDCNITVEGYAHCYDTTFRFQDIPVFYTPWLAFPVKTERASGLLASQYGADNQNGFRYKQPLFIVIDDSTDFTVTPFIDTLSRVGSSVGYRQVFSDSSSIDSRLIYSNEEKRGDSLRGLVPFNDPELDQIDTNRFGAYLSQRWRPAPENELPIELITDGHYVSDNFFLREIEDPDIGQLNSQFLTSTAVLRAQPWSNVSAEMRGEYNQVFSQRSELTLHRAPEFSLAARESFRPFGVNPYGIKLNTGVNVLATKFVRQEGFDGWRMTFRPQAAVPFHVANYFRGTFSAEVRRNEYRLDNSSVPGVLDTAPLDDRFLDDNQGVTLPMLRYNMRTVVERVYESDRDSWFNKTVMLGADNEGKELTKLKHTIEPTLDYIYVPGIAQGQLPQFDAQLDRLRETSLFAYGFRSRLYGRFQTPYTRTRDIGELTPTVSSLPQLDVSQALQQFTSGATVTTPTNIGLRSGEVRELMSFGVRQTYDYKIDHQGRGACGDDESPEACAARLDAEQARRPYSDVALDFVLAPSNYFAVQFDSNIDYEERDFSNYGVSIGFKTDREDLFRARYSFVETALATTEQLEANIEVKLVDQIRLGYYGRYDQEGGGFIENRGLLRFISDCRCWSIDVGVGERVNPDRRQFLISFNFSGLGDITQDIGVFRAQPQANQTDPLVQ